MLSLLSSSFSLVLASFGLCVSSLMYFCSLSLFSTTEPFALRRELRIEADCDTSSTEEFSDWSTERDVSSEVAMTEMSIISVSLKVLLSSIARPVSPKSGSVVSRALWSAHSDDQE
ncbi:hypothetical protein B484DRAFT_459845 [Ochromonadaceae sp. CCMP2298]|nr:hypothetical protein B484DRAFT_459845 [Ochromonadaceae sp. CCMP2298]